VDKAKLLAARTHDSWEPVEINESGDSVLVRPLTRAEAFSLRGKKMAEEILEIKVLSMAMVDPELTEEEVREWQNVAPSKEVDRVVERVLIISGMREDSAKAAYKSDGDGE
jgi:hypothetical protein